MLHVLLAACATLIFVLVLAVPRSARARRLARLFGRRRSGLSLIDRESQPRQECPLAAPWRGPRKEDDPAILPAPRTPPWPSRFLDSLMADAEPEMPDDIAP